MAQQDISTYKSGKNVLFADNTSRAISEADSRTAFENTADSFLNKTDEFRDPVKGLTATHAANAYTVTAANYAAYTTNIPLVLKPNATNSGSAPTINVNSIGAKTWKKKDGTDFIASDIVSGEYYIVIYDGTDFITIAGVANTESSNNLIKVSLDSSEISNAHTTAIPAISAPGAGKAIQILSATSKLNYGTAAYNSGSIVIDYVGLGIPYSISNAMNSVVSGFRVISYTSGNMGDIENVAVEIGASVDLGGTGDGTIDIYITYSIITL